MRKLPRGGSPLSQETVAGLSVTPSGGDARPSVSLPLCAGILEPGGTKAAEANTKAAHSCEAGYHGDCHSGADIATMLNTQRRSDGSMVRSDGSHMTPVTARSYSGSSRPYSGREAPRKSEVGDTDDSSLRELNPVVWLRGDVEPAAAKATWQQSLADALPPFWDPRWLSKARALARGAAHAPLRAPPHIT